MGVFDRFLRKSKTVEVTRSAGAEATKPTTAAAARTADEAEGAATAGTVAVRPAQVAALPGRRSAEEAADSEADEGART
ncbi:hypothetical protein [Streptomyces colonosanans]|uniref:Gliding motility protein n=1 Tax=Streptomyces colonosanans TaxID=1428652 RepID=A0A1S2P2H3_9ACTN|nr:hypothetical protein [Streptomyces colonosanans]OIJ87950.1 hypothetical protein BIV24_23570 [Streptomyces colonosanans]